MPAVNLDIVYDLVTGHRVGLERFSSGVVKKINKLLLAAQGEVDDAIVKILGRYRKGYDLDTSVLQRMSVLAQQLKALLSEAYGAMHGDLKTELVAVAKHEAEWAAATYSKAMKIGGVLDLPSGRLLEAIVTSRPFEGRILKDWSRQLEQGALHRVIQQINLGLVEGEGIDDIRDRAIRPRFRAPSISSRG